MATRTVSNNAPTVSVSLPGGGVVKTINWTANDLDGDTLSYSVLYSADNKQSWFAVATDLNATTYSLDTSTLPGGTNAFVRILASDGVNTGQADAGPFVVTGKDADRADQLAGRWGNLRAGPDRAAWWAMASTWRMARCPKAVSIWTSDRDGVLGAGRTLERSDLSEGTHTITLTAGDSQGNQATASIT